MKELFSVLVLIVFSLFSNCSNEKAHKIQPAPIKRFVAYRNGDTAIALLKMSESIFKGQLVIKYERGYKDSGEVKGAIKGDTLIGDYHFQHYDLPKWKRDPIIFLKRGKKLIRGNGVIKYTLGFPGFNKNIPIDFDENKIFVFEQID